jgi:hypothetical protein
LTFFVLPFVTVFVPPLAAGTLALVFALPFVVVAFVGDFAFPLKGALALIAFLEGAFTFPFTPVGAFGGTFFLEGGPCFLEGGACFLEGGACFLEGGACLLLGGSFEGAFVEGGRDLGIYSQATPSWSLLVP